MSEITVTAVDYRNMKPEDVFEWLELFLFRRYACKYHVDPKKRDDPRYPAEQDESPIGWYTHINVPSRFYGKNVVIMDEELYEKIKHRFKEILVDTKSL